jgi:hypothetical protein
VSKLFDRSAQVDEAALAGFAAYFESSQGDATAKENKIVDASLSHYEKVRCPPPSPHPPPYYTPPPSSYSPQPHISRSRGYASAAPSASPSPSSSPCPRRSPLGSKPLPTSTCLPRACSRTSGSS